MKEKPNVNNFQKRVFQLCLAIYRVTGLFPKQEVLINQIRELANEIAGDLAASLTLNKLDAKIGKLITYLQIAKAQNWLKPINFEVLIKEYQTLKNDVKEKLLVRALEKGKGLTSRQQKILDFLQEKKEAKMSDFLNLFKEEVTERTLRWDLKFLLSQGLIKKKGEFKTTKYFI